MSETVPFKCASCGGGTFKLSTQPKSYNDLIGAACATCGTKLTEAEIKRQAGDMAAKALKDAFKNKRL